MTTSLGATLLALAANDDSRVSPGVLGFIVVALLGVATWLLIRSMGRQLKKIDLPDDGVPTDPDAVERRPSARRARRRRRPRPGQRRRRPAGSVGLGPRRTG